MLEAKKAAELRQTTRTLVKAHDPTPFLSQQGQAKLASGLPLRLAGQSQKLERIKLKALLAKALAKFNELKIKGGPRAPPLMQALQREMAILVQSLSTLQARYRFN